MHPQEAAGACDPEPDGVLAHQTAIALRQVFDTVARVRQRGCHDACLSLTRPTPMIETMWTALRDAGLRCDVVRAAGGCSRLILWT